MAVVNAYLIRSLPYPAADRLYHVIYAPPGRPEPRGMALIDWPSLAEVVDVADTSAGDWIAPIVGGTVVPAGLSSSDWANP